MRREYCHICKDGAKECIDVDAKGRVYLEMFNATCAKCGRPLIS